MRYLIDGYNLLYAMGVLRGPVGPHGLEKARLGLLGQVRGAHGAGASDVTVVFDASRAPPGADPEAEYQGIQIRYALRQEADDLIDELIRHDSAPRGLAVVSDDHRVQQAARRRQCVVLGCEAYLDHLEKLRHARPEAPEEGATKPDGVSGAELERWLREFADLADDPRLNEGFGEAGETG
jgi:predicted RNA-binding protein with PIN domain